MTNKNNSGQPISEPDVMYFDSDEEFTDFCVAPYAQIKCSDSGTYYYDGEYSNEYLSCIENDITFIIKDEDSRVYKRMCVTKRVPVMHNGIPTGRDALIQLEVQNLKEYYNE